MKKYFHIMEVMQMQDHGLRYLANCSMLFTEHPLLERPQAAKDAGFDAVEFWWPWPDQPDPGDAEVAAFVSAVGDAGVQLVGLNFFAGDLAGPDCGVLSIPDRAAQFRANIDVAVGIGEQLGVSAFNALYGNRVEGVTPEEQDHGDRHAEHQRDNEREAGHAHIVSTNRYIATLASGQRSTSAPKTPWLLLLPPPHVLISPHALPSLRNSSSRAETAPHHANLSSPRALPCPARYSSCGKQASRPTPTRLSLGTRSIRAAKPLLARLLHRQSVGALTGRAAFPSHGLRSRNRLQGALGNATA